MRLLDGMPLWANAAIFVVAAVIVWFAGTRLSRGADAVSERTGLGQAFVGALLLGGLTSLPEIATTISASLIGSADIAVNNIFGGIAMQVAVLALADAVLRKGSLSGGTTELGIAVEGVLLVLVLAVAVAAIAAGDVLVFGVFGAWTFAIFALVVGSLVIVKRYEDDPQWKPKHERKRSRERKKESGAADLQKRSTPVLTLYIAAAGGAVLIAGFALAQSGERIGEQTGVGASFVGAVLIAIATSLPEISTTVEAAKLGLRTMAISNIFGTNLFDSALLFVADLAYPGAAILTRVGTFAQIAALLAITCIAIYLVGILERSKRAVMRLGFDSVLVVITYAGGLILLYVMR